MTLEEVYEKYGDPFYIGSKHMVWKAGDLGRAIKATKPGYLSDGSIIITSQPWHEPADPIITAPFRIRDGGVFGTLWIYTDQFI